MDLISRLRQRLLRAVFVLLPMAASLPAQSSDFLTCYQQLRSETEHCSATQQTDLQRHPLAPYLQLEQLKRTLAQQPTREAIEPAVLDFLEDYDGEVPALQLRYHWLKYLAEQREWAAYRQHYRRGYGERFRCWQAQALYQQTDSHDADQLAEQLWRQGRSVADECDAVFQQWQANGGLNDEQRWQRILLAAQQDNRTLWHYLARQLHDSLYRTRLAALEQAYQQPDRWFSETPLAEDIRLLTLALTRLAQQDPVTAGARLLQHRSQLTAADWSTLRQTIARQWLASEHPGIDEWLAQTDPDGDDSYLTAWRIRLALSLGQWPGVIEQIDRLPLAEAASPRWRYWRARAEQATGEAEHSLQDLQLLAHERHYYGFLAAQRLGLPPALNHQPLRLPDSISPYQLLQRSPSLRRARAWWVLDQVAAAEREWQQASRQFTPTEHAAASRLAEQWGWHSQALRAAQAAGYSSDLELRFPLAHQAPLQQAATDSGVETAWLLALARQESAFNPHARSPVGARGLLQLMPATARQTAKTQRLPFNLSRLEEPAYNAQLAGFYLAQLQARFHHPLLASAAYNAGPARIQRWLERQPQLQPFDIWLETLPYYETRHYVQNVLSYRLIYRARLAQQAPLADALPLRLLEPQEYWIGTPQQLALQQANREPTPILN